MSNMRSRRTNHFQIASIFQEAEKEKIEQQIAQIAILTCETAHDTIAQGVHNILDGLKEKHKSKYEYNKERKRDFRVGKKKVEHKPLFYLGEEEEKPKVEELPLIEEEVAEEKPVYTSKYEANKQKKREFFVGKGGGVKSKKPTMIAEEEKEEAPEPLTLEALSQKMQEMSNDGNQKPSGDERKSKYEYNQDRKRDFTFSKVSFAPKEDPLLAAMKKKLKEPEKLVSPFPEPKIDPNNFYRHYKYDIFNQTMKTINYYQFHRQFDHLLVVDLANQCITDEHFKNFALSIRSFLIEVINLSQNSITDKSMITFATVLRSLPALRSLNLAYNQISDYSIKLLSDSNTYSSSLEELNISYNKLTSISAYYLSFYYLEEYTTKLKKLILGGKVQYMSTEFWGNEFLKIFVGALLSNQSNQIHIIEEISLNGFGMDEEGYNYLLLLLMANNNRIKIINISNNYLPNIYYRKYFIQMIQFLVFRKMNPNYAFTPPNTLMKLFQTEKPINSETNENSSLLPTPLPPSESTASSFQILAYDCGFTLTELQYFQDIFIQSEKKIQEKKLQLTNDNSLKSESIAVIISTEKLFSLQGLSMIDWKSLLFLGNASYSMLYQALFAVYRMKVTLLNTWKLHGPMKYRPPLIETHYRPETTTPGPSSSALMPRPPSTNANPSSKLPAAQQPSVKPLPPGSPPPGAKRAVLPAIENRSLEGSSLEESESIEGDGSLAEGEDEDDSLIFLLDEPIVVRKKDKGDGVPPSRSGGGAAVHSRGGGDSLSGDSSTMSHSIQKHQGKEVTSPGNKNGANAAEKKKTVNPKALLRQQEEAEAKEQTFIYQNDSSLLATLQKRLISSIQKQEKDRQSSSMKNNNNQALISSQQQYQLQSLTIEELDKETNTKSSMRNNGGGTSSNASNNNLGGSTRHSRLSRSMSLRSQRLLSLRPTSSGRSGVPGGGGGGSSSSKSSIPHGSEAGDFEELLEERVYSTEIINKQIDFFLEIQKKSKHCLLIWNYSIDHILNYLEKIFMKLYSYQQQLKEEEEGRIKTRAMSLMMAKNNINGGGQSQRSNSPAKVSIAANPIVLNSSNTTNNNMSSSNDNNRTPSPTRRGVRSTMIASSPSKSNLLEGNASTSNPNTSPGPRSRQSFSHGILKPSTPSTTSFQDHRPITPTAPIPPPVKRQFSSSTISACLSNEEIETLFFGMEDCYSQSIRKGMLDQEYIGCLYHQNIIFKYIQEKQKIIKEFEEREKEKKLMEEERLKYEEKMKLKIEKKEAKKSKANLLAHHHAHGHDDDADDDEEDDDVTKDDQKTNTDTHTQSNSTKRLQEVSKYHLKHNFHDIKKNMEEDEKKLEFLSYPFLYYIHNILNINFEENLFYLSYFFHYYCFIYQKEKFHV